MKKAGDQPDAAPVTAKSTPAPAPAASTTTKNSSGVNALLAQLGGAMKKAGDKPDGTLAATTTTTTTKTSSGVD